MDRSAGAAAVVGLGRALGVDPVFESRSGSEIQDRFDDVFRSEGIEVVRTPFRAPQANGVAKRFVRTARSECFDRVLILNQQHLERVLQAFIDHDNGHRPHSAPSSRHLRHGGRLQCPRHRVMRRDRLGGVVHEYVRAPSTRISHPTQKIHVSKNGGAQVRWRHDGREPSMSLDGRLTNSPKL
jgi:hypothetical protein